ncbi:disintegrin and metalloproteinase domain-containing protein 10-like isoform X3 [Ostrea edulis]|uniref:disintegrin and metalloproteinase domain-containing protein 10-like isoform X3 n=1 Tax=Ostrea edulis TaxID=37623 RepID=UPI0024AFCF2D|nr:disintegrin and metalloproteinase domain-containing protein 10-like isoform X3 [Ostrea edulis]
MRTLHAVLCLIVCWTPCLAVMRALDDYIQHYEELSYNTQKLHSKHMRAKRSTQNKGLDLKFKAHDREFHLDLKPSTSVFTENFRSTHNNGTEDPVDLSILYEGSVVGEPGSHVHGAVILGIFRGTIRIPGDTLYHIEPAYRFYGLKEAQKLSYHSVIYKDEHVNLDPYRHKREVDAEAGRCAFDNFRNWMVHQTEAEVNIRQKRAFYSKKESFAHNKYSAEFNDDRHRRAARSGSCSLGTQNTCILYMRSDPTLFNRFKSDLNGNENAARDEILSFFASHVSALNEIYGRTKFEPLTGKAGSCFQGVQFQIQRTTIMTDQTENCSNVLKKTAFCQPNIDVSNFLNLNSLTNHDAFCLAYIFTYRDFSHGTLGLAWVGSPSASAGGICEKFKSYTEGNQQVKKSLNTGIVTIINYNKRVAPRVSQLTFAHEVGHNFGSPHDDGQECAPYGTGSSGSNNGNYIMFASATQGNLANNDDFSPCSKDNITYVIDAVSNSRNGKVNCFTQSNMAFCGNGIVEGDEECDCGYLEDCNDICCNPRLTGNQNTNGCTRKINPSTNQKYECSPTQGPCCSATCSFVQNQALKCRAETDCMKAQLCNGITAQCPDSVKEPDLKICNDHSQVCLDGFCTGSLCLAINSSNGNRREWEECFITKSGDLTVAQKEELCNLACRRINFTACYASYSKDNGVFPPEFKKLLDEVNRLKGSTGGLKLPAGSPCNNYQGYCDVFSRCRGVDNEGPLQRLKNLIFSEKTLSNIKNWIIEYWWAVMLMGIGLILFMGLFIKICAVHTPSSNPNAKPAQKFGDTLRRRRSRPQQYRAQQKPDGHRAPRDPHHHTQLKEAPHRDIERVGLKVESIIT